MEPFLSAISYYCKKLKVLEIDLHNSFDDNKYMLDAWNRFYLNEETGKLYQTHRILNEPVAKYLCEYILRDPKDRAPEELPTQCRIKLKLTIKRELDVPEIVHTIGLYTRHVQSLVIDRSKSHSFMNENRKTEYGVTFDIAWNHLPVSYPSSLMHIRS